MKVRFVEAEKAQHPVSLLCAAAGITPAGYYAARHRPASARQRRDEELRALVRESWERSRRTYGAPRIHADLAAGGVPVGRKRVARLMRQQALTGVSRRGSRRTTIRDAAAVAAPDRVERRFAAPGPNQLWVADITYIPTLEGWLFLAVVMDAWSRRIVGWSMRDDLEAQLVVDALGMAVTRRRPAAGLVHHSDRGSQYTSLAFGRTLRDAGIVASMGSRGDAYDNAAAESCISTIKNELVHQHRFTTRDQARLAVFDYIEGFYNPHRRHSRLDHKSPIEYEILNQTAVDAA